METITTNVDEHYHPTEQKRNIIPNKSLSATDNLSEPKRTVVRSLSVSEPVDIEIRRNQRRHDHAEHMHKRPDSPGVVSAASHEEKEEVKSKRYRRKTRGRSRHRFYEPSGDRFPRPGIMKSNFKVVQEMPFWRLDANKFRRTVSSYEPRERIEERWRLQALQDMPFSQFPWKKVQNLFMQPDLFKLERKRMKSDKRRKAAGEKLARQQRLASVTQARNSYVAQDHKITIRQRPQSISECRSAVPSSEAETKIKMTTNPSCLDPRDGTAKPPLMVAQREFKSPKEAATKSKTPEKGKFVSSASSKLVKLRPGGAACRSCEREAYRVESIEALGQVFHSSCFRCAGCMTLLQRGNWYHREGKFYCNPCHRKLSLQTFRR